MLTTVTRLAIFQPIRADEIDDFQIFHYTKARLYTKAILLNTFIFIAVTVTYHDPRSPAVRAMSLNIITHPLRAFWLPR